MDEREPIRRTEIEVRGVDREYGGLLDVVIHLSAEPHPEWARHFENAAMSVSMHRPKLTGATVRVTPPDDHLDVYVKHVDERIDIANLRFQEMSLPQLRAEADRRQAEITEREERLRRARERAQEL